MAFPNFSNNQGGNDLESHPMVYEIQRAKVYKAKRKEKSFDSMVAQMLIFLKCDAFFIDLLLFQSAL